MSLYVRPREGERFLDITTREPIPAEGLEVPASPFWLRAIRRGDVLEGKPKAAAPKRATRKTKERLAPPED